MTKRCRSLLVLTLLVLASCSSAQNASNAAKSTATSNVASNETPTTSARPTTAPTVAASVAPKRLLTITSFGFGKAQGSFDFNSLGYGYTIRNENASEAAESVSVQIAFTDAAGTVVATESDTIAYLGPGEHTGLAGSSFSASAKTAVKMTVQALPSKWTAVGTLPVFSFSKVTYLSDQYSSKVTGIVTSPFAKDYKLVRVSTIGVDAAGQIVGGGFGYSDFVPANGSAAVSVSYTGIKPATVVLYAQLSSLSTLSTP